MAHRPNFNRIEALVIRTLSLLLLTLAAFRLLVEELRSLSEGPGPFDSAGALKEYSVRDRGRRS